MATTAEQFSSKIADDTPADKRKLKFAMIGYINDITWCVYNVTAGLDRLHPEK